ncbi:MAG: GNAT family N-acetyltransferase [Candidatus Bathyarchaeota archaeon]|nr:MAG: GNAT family N-acetyltransferase [Candidatus Bathyarchaeota archaeon]
MKIKILRREEIEKVRGIDRSEIVKQIYYHKDGKLTLEDEFYDVRGWNPSELEGNIKHLHDLYDRDGTLFGAFEEDRLIGISALESKFIGRKKDQLQLYFHHVDKHYRHKGIGERLLGKIIEKARELGARKLYISATPSRNTIDFYMHMGCRLTSELNPELYRLEPEDIHLELKLY